jgi:hypothetical protein
MNQQNRGNRCVCFGEIKTGASLILDPVGRIAGMRHTRCILVLNVFVVLCSGGELRPNHVAINERRKHIDVDTPWLDKNQRQVQQVGLDASDKEKVLLDLVTERKQLSASAHGNFVAAETSDGQRAQAQRFGEKGGLAQVEGHK